MHASPCERPYKNCFHIFFPRESRRPAQLSVTIGAAPQRTLWGMYISDSQARSGLICSLTCEPLSAGVLAAPALVAGASLRHWVAFSQLWQTRFCVEWKRNSVCQASAAWSSSSCEHETPPPLQQLRFRVFHLLCLAALAMYDLNLDVNLFAESFPLGLSGRTRFAGEARGW